MQRILVLAPHTDDAELGCGGTIALLRSLGREVFVASFSVARESLPAGSPSNLLIDEFVSSMSVLGVDKLHLQIYEYPVRRVSNYRQEVLDNLIELRKKFNPDTVFLPSEHDLHQDHQVLNVEGLRAYKDLTVLGYELPWNHITYRAQAFVPLTEEHLQLKWRALQEYKSQIALKRPYFEWGFIEGLARVRGMQIKALYAESFEVVRINFGSL